LDFDFAKLLIIFPVLLFSMTAHEWAHGYAALKQGDPTAYRNGYVTWNPIKYVDPIMTIIVPIISTMNGFPFMGMRSGPIDSRNFRNFKRGDLIVSFAGVFANLVLSFLCAVVFILLGIIAQIAPGAAGPLSTLQHMTAWGIFLNLLLVGINTLPLPPFDGSALPRHFLPPAWALEYQKLVPFGFLIMIFIFTIGSPILNFWLGPAFTVVRFLRDVTVPFSLGGAWNL
jgi:Zn-dependent protease